MEAADNGKYLKINKLHKKKPGSLGRTGLLSFVFLVKNFDKIRELRNRRRHRFLFGCSTFRKGMR